MFTVIYRWRIKPEFEKQFIENWSEITAEYYLKCDGAQGSRLHRGSDDLWYAYAQWKSAEDRESAFQNIPDLAVREKMKEAIEESFPEVRLEIMADFLIFSENQD
jgi:hypothetical protein